MKIQTTTCNVVIYFQEHIIYVTKSGTIHVASGLRYVAVGKITNQNYRKKLFSGNVKSCENLVNFLLHHNLLDVSTKKED